MNDEKGKVKSLSKAIDLLDALTASRQGMTLSELSERCGYPKSTTHALASTMRDRGLLRQLPDGSYALGMRLFEYGSAVSRGFDISALARPYLESLSSLTGANSVISLLDGENAVSFDYAVSSTGVQILPEIGVRLPLHCTSQGKLMLAFMPSKKVISLYKRQPMRQFTPHTISDIDSLLRQLSEICGQGYAVEDGEYKVGLRSVSAPVFDSSGTLKYAMTTIGFFRRVRSDDFVSAIQATVRQADMLSAALGYEGGNPL
ncbi:MAG: IclR family transcriptional regulator [Ruminococcus sp.]|nr:IclR family transcriptional regulator [Ruminococcus sp.]MBQ6153734.1 IclR family transcriptional regulator [Ruminococcus sp.]